MPTKILLFLKNTTSSLWKYAIAHKILATIAGLVVLYAGYYTYGIFTAPSTATRYVTTTVATSTVVKTMTETGQVSASSNIDIQSKSSGEVLSLLVTAGQHVYVGTALAYLDSTNANQGVISARQALQAAEISLAKLKQPATASQLTSAQNALASAQANLALAHQNGYNDVSAAFLTLPGVITGIDTILHGNTVPGRTSQQNENAYSDMTESYDATVVQYRTTAESAYQTAYTSYTKTLADFKATSRSADVATIEALVKESYLTAAAISDALKASTNFLNFVSTTLAAHNLSLPSTLTAHTNTLTGYTTTTNSHVATLSADTTSVTSSERAVAASEASLAELQSGADPLDIQSSLLSVQMKEDSLAVAEQNLADTVVRAPFSGTVAKLNVQQYQTIGSGTAVATMVSDNQSVNISVNEVDAAKLKVGQKATLTFDALPTISIASTVSSINTIGTVSSGVVSYAAVVTFDTPNTDVKPGMSATADIVLGVETGLMVPSSAIKTINGQGSVEIFNPSLSGSDTSTGAVSPILPTRVAVTTGLSNDTSIIITGGLSEGTQVVTRTVMGTTATTAKTSAAASTSLFGGSAGGATYRAPGR
ncbi:MAG: HlyD family efflux transporter periplasmic adaptor subunit [Candidatus Kaiserbacteria bacterium]|nr:HlyD family efflux transporter periplasmic adaptor subunit [Candidatus Kaiserbacteria bacterium]